MFRTAPRRGFTLLEVVVAASLTAILAALMLYWVRDLAETSMAGADAVAPTQTAAIIDTRIRADLSSATACSPSAPPGTLAGLSESTMSVYVADETGDGNADRADWSLRPDGFVRSLYPSTGPCSFDLTDPVDQVITSTVDPNPAVFSAYSGTTEVPLPSFADCAASAASCQFDSVALALVLRGPQLDTPVRFAQTFPVPVSPSSPAAVTPVAAPGAPGITAVTPAAGAVQITWDAPTDGGSPITGYTVTAWEGAVPAGVIGANPRAAGTMTSFSFDGLAAGHNYSFTVTASNAVGTSPVSAASAVVSPT